MKLYKITFKYKGQKNICVNFIDAKTKIGARIKLRKLKDNPIKILSVEKIINVIY